MIRRYRICRDEYIKGKYDLAFPGSGRSPTRALGKSGAVGFRMATAEQSAVRSDGGFRIGTGELRTSVLRPPR